MKTVLRELFDGGYDITPIQDKKQQGLDKKLWEEWSEAQRVLGTGYIERILDLEGEREDSLNFHYYQAGFRLGARLMLEALRDQ